MIILMITTMTTTHPHATLFSPNIKESFSRFQYTLLSEFKVFRPSSFYFAFKTLRRGLALPRFEPIFATFFAKLTQLSILPG